jgi:AsmA protein
VLTAGVTRTGVYGGQVQGTLVVDASRAEPSHALRVDLTGVRALPLLSDVASFDAIDGRMQAKIDARGRGASPHAIMLTLGGAVDLLVEDGEIRSVNIARMIRSLAASTLSGWQENRTEKTDLSQLSAFFQIDNGQAWTDNFRLLGPLVRVTGTGAADLGAKTLQFKVEPKLVLSLEGQGGAVDPIGIGVPVAVEGPWAAPRIYPDMAGILDNPEAAYTKLRELGTGLFGAKAGLGLPGSPGNPLPQNIESLIDRLGGDKPAAVPLPPAAAPRPAPQAQSRPAPAQPATPAPAQSSSSSQSTTQGGPIDFFQKLFGR